MTDPEDPYFYLDGCATAPLRESVITCMVKAQQNSWGNPSSLHRIGCDAAESLERARLSIGNSLGADRADILFSSGATESAHLALLGLAKTESVGRLVISAVEHPAVAAAAQQLIRCGWTVERWPVDGYGQIQLQHLDRLLEPPTKLVSLIWGQSEVGTLQPIQAVGEACRSKGIPFHTDATQVLSQGCPNWHELPVDLLTASAHKCGGPRGIGLLLLRPNIAERIQPLLTGGQQEQGLRAGTECAVLAQGMAAAFRDIAPCQPNQVSSAGSGWLPCAIPCLTCFARTEPSISVDIPRSVFRTIFPCWSPIGMVSRCRVGPWFGPWIRRASQQVAVVPVPPAEIRTVLSLRRWTWIRCGVDQGCGSVLAIGLTLQPCLRSATAFIERSIV